MGQHQKYHHRWSYSGRGTNRNGRGQWVQLLRDRTNNTLELHWSPCGANNTYLEKFNRNCVLHKIKPNSGKPIANTTAQLRPERNQNFWANNIDTGVYSSKCSSIGLVWCTNCNEYKPQILRSPKPVCAQNFHHLWGNEMVMLAYMAQLKGSLYIQPPYLCHFCSCF